MKLATIKRKFKEIDTEGYCQNCMVGTKIINVPKEKCKCSCHKTTKQK